MPTALFPTLGWGFRGLGLLQSCPPQHRPPPYRWGWQGMRSPPWRGFRGGSSAVLPATPGLFWPVAVPAAQCCTTCSQTLSVGPAGPPACAPELNGRSTCFITPTVPYIYDRKPTSGSQGSPSQGQGAGGPGLGLCALGGHEVLDLGQKCTEGPGPLLGLMHSGPLLHPVSGKGPLLRR